jgi:hypothetical protein
MEKSVCKLCGEPMPEGEEMFFYHGYSGNCPSPPKQVPSKSEKMSDVIGSTKCSKCGIPYGAHRSAFCDDNELHIWQSKKVNSITIEKLKHKFDCVMGMPVGPFTYIEGRDKSKESVHIQQLMDRMGMLEALTNDIILYLEEREVK